MTLRGSVNPHNCEFSRILDYTVGNGTMTPLHERLISLTQCFAQLTAGPYAKSTSIYRRIKNIKEKNTELRPLLS